MYMKKIIIALLALTLAVTLNSCTKESTAGKYRELMDFDAPQEMKCGTFETFAGKQAQVFQ